MREASNAFATRYRQVRRQSRRGFAKLMTTGQTLLDPERAPETTLADLLHELDEASLREAVRTCAERQYRGSTRRDRYPPGTLSGSQAVFPGVLCLTLSK